MNLKEKNYLAWQKERGFFSSSKKRVPDKKIFFIGNEKLELLPAGKTMLANIIAALKLPTQDTGFALISNSSFDEQRLQIKALLQKNTAVYFILLGEEITQASLSQAHTLEKPWKDCVCQLLRSDHQYFLPVWSIEDMTEKPQLKAQTWHALKTLLERMSS